MRKFRTKKAYTLVELVVTVAILSITATIGVGIFASTLRTYSAASVTAREQDAATEIETFLTRYARKCSGFYYIMSDPSEYNPGAEDGAFDTVDANQHFVTGKEALALDENNSRYIVLDPQTHKLTYKINERDGEGFLDMPEMTVNGVEKLEFEIVKQKRTTEALDKKAFYYLNYTIVMMEGYTLKGSVIMYNVKNISSESSDEDDSPDGEIEANYTENVDNPSRVTFDGEYTTECGIGFIESI